MIRRVSITLRPDRKCSACAHWAYPLYADLLQRAPSDCGELLHQEGIHPMSQFLQVRPDGNCQWNVTFLGENILPGLETALLDAKEFFLRNEEIHLDVCNQSIQTISSLETLLTENQWDGYHRLNFAVPTAFKQKDHYGLLPEPRRILRSSVQKWNGSFPQFPIEDEGGGLDTMAEGLVIRSLHLDSKLYPIKNQKIPGFTGHLVLENHLAGFHKTLANALLCFCGYAGVGIKTTLGMGGVIYERIPAKKI